MPSCSVPNMTREHDALRERLGMVGAWTFAFDARPADRVRTDVRELEEIGYTAIWVPEGSSSRDDAGLEVRSIRKKPCRYSRVKGINSLDEIDNRIRVKVEAAHRSPQASRSSWICRSISSLERVPGGRLAMKSKMSCRGCD